MPLPCGPHPQQETLDAGFSNYRHTTILFIILFYFQHHIHFFIKTN